MGTRGLVGFVVNDEELLSYNHYDSYPSSLGVETLAFLKAANLPEMLVAAKALQRVPDSQAVPTADQIATLRLAGISGPEQVDTGNNWYAWLRSCQGDLARTLQVGYMIVDPDFALDSLFCEWAYVIDCDHATFEVYRGFQEQPHGDGRFADRWDREATWVPNYDGDKRWYPIRLVATYSLEHLPTPDVLEALDD